MDPHRRGTKKNMSHGIEVLPQDTMHLIQRPCYQWESLCQDPAGSQTTQRPPEHLKETQTVVVWMCLLFIRSGQNHLARQIEKMMRIRQTQKELGKQQGMDWPGVCQVPGSSVEQRKMEETGCEVFCGAPTTPTVKDRWKWRACSSALLAKEQNADENLQFHALDLNCRSTQCSWLVAMTISLISVSQCHWHLMSYRFKTC